jgi:hypothetical protein
MDGHRTGRIGRVHFSYFARRLLRPPRILKNYLPHVNARKLFRMGNAALKLLSEILQTLQFYYLMSSTQVLRGR